MNEEQREELQEGINEALSGGFKYATLNTDAARAALAHIDALEARVGELEAACGGWSSALAEAMEDLTEQQARADALAAERDALASQVAELVKAIEHPSESSVSRRCSWCEQPYTTVVTLQPTPADNERIKADARQHFLTCVAHPAVAAKEQAEREKDEAEDSAQGLADKLRQSELDREGERAFRQQAERTAAALQARVVSIRDRVRAGSEVAPWVIAELDAALTPTKEEA